MNTAQILADLRAQRDRINNAITALEALGGTSAPTKTATKAPAPAPAKSAKKAPPIVTKRVISPEARQRMAEAQQKRWAKKKRAVKAAAKKAATPVATKKVATETPKA
jgi:type IV secretory pathway VirB10-like protein